MLMVRFYFNFTIEAPRLAFDEKKSALLLYHRPKGRCGQDRNCLALSPAAGKSEIILAIPVEVGWQHTNSYVSLHSFFVRSRVKSLIPRLPTTFSPNPPANPALPFGTCPKHPKHVATPSHTLSGPANQALGWLVRVVKSLCFCGVNVCMCRNDFLVS